MLRGEEVLVYFLETNYAFMNRLFHCFSLLIECSKRIPIGTAGKKALKYGNLPSFRVVGPKRAKVLHHKLVNFTDDCMVGEGEGRTCPPPLLTIQTLGKAIDLHRLDPCKYVANFFVKPEE